MSFLGPTPPSQVLHNLGVTSDQSFRWEDVPILRTTALLVAALTIQPRYSLRADTRQDTAIAVRSPRLQRLHDRLAAADPAAEPQFWREVTESGAPLVEAIGGEPRYRHVTFLYHGDIGTRNVLVLTLDNSQAANDRYLALGRMVRLGASNAWYQTYRLRADARFVYRIGMNDDGKTRLLLSDSAWSRKLANLGPDPLNRRQVETRNGTESLLELPDAPPQPLIARRGNVPRGTLAEFPFHSTILGNDRTVKAYTSPGYGASKQPARLLIVLDGDEVPETFPIPTILDNLEADHRIRPTVAIMIGNGPGAARLEELWNSEAFTRFVRDELFPWIRTRYRVTTDPRGIAIAGRSLGASAAAFVAFRMPTLFGNVIAQSGGFASPQTRAQALPRPYRGELLADDFPEQEWLATQYAAAPRLPVRFYLEAGTMEDVEYDNSPLPAYARGTVLRATRHFRDVLTAKGYWLRYHEYNGDHQPINWRGTVGEALAAVWSPGPG